jgi:DNA-binding NarL/FixJ family response regulator
MRLILADDSLLFREGLARLLTDAGFLISGKAKDATELVGLVKEDPPDVAVVDIRMPPTHTIEGLEAARWLRMEFPTVGVLVLSQYVETHYAMQLLDAAVEDNTSVGHVGGAGYLLKDRVNHLDELSDAIRRVASGGYAVDPAVVSRLVGRRMTSSPLDDLTKRELTVLALMAEGRSNIAISRALFLSPKTVEAHTRRIFSTLGLGATEDDNRRVLAVLTFLRK